MCVAFSLGLLRLFTPFQAWNSAIVFPKDPLRSDEADAFSFEETVARAGHDHDTGARCRRSRASSGR
jgi:hypothetical protein